MSARPVCVASSTAHAVPILHHQKPDVLVADVPERDGLQLVEEASQMHDLRPVIVAVTAVGSAATARRVFDAGFDAYLPRPIDEQDLAWAVRELIRERRTSEPV